MPLCDRLYAETRSARTAFLSLPLIGHALAGAVPQALYVEFLQQAYHLVRHSCPLLSLAAARTDDPVYRDALFRTLGEKRGHDDGILADIAAMGGNAAETVRSQPDAPCRAMIGYAYYAIEWISPYALLGMVHVLDGMSALLAGRVAKGLQTAFLAPTDGAGFTYLTARGARDPERAALFEDLLDRLRSPFAIDVIADNANQMYWLYGNLFRRLEARMDQGRRRACA